MTIETRPELLAMIQRAVEAYREMTPAERARMMKQQRRSWARAEAGFGSDADEAAYRAALEAGDAATISRLNAEAEARVRAMEAVYARD